MANKKIEWEDNIDWGRLFRYLLSKWVYFVISIGSAYIIALIYLHYQSPIHTVTTTILIKTSSNSIDRSLGGLNLTNEDRSLNNQISIIHSYKFIRKTLDELDFGVSYFHAGNVRTIELYGENPFRIEVDSNHVQLLQVPIYISFKPNNRYIIQTLKPANGRIINLKSQLIEKSGVKNFELYHEGIVGQPYKSDYFSFTIFLNAPNIPYSNEEEPKLYFVFNDLDILAQSIKNRLIIEPEKDKGSSILKLSLSGPVLQKDIAFL
ncbi:MAG: hypothetical protein K2Q22_01160, partial [Cytophagales bacterium]|nr:hypothetical protein [Cytophagales bacterium]